MANEYVLVATKPDDSKLFWTWTGFSAKEERAARMVSLDFADTTFVIERKAHPDWRFDIRVYETQPSSRYRQKLGAQIGVIEQIHPYIPKPSYSNNLEHSSRVGCDECGQKATNYVESRNECPTDRGVEIRSSRIYLCDECRNQHERRS